MTLAITPPPVSSPFDKNGTGPMMPWVRWIVSVQSILSTVLKLNTAFQGYTVATLPAAGTVGRRTYVTDAVSPTFLGTLTGGGSVVTPVFDNGTKWVSA